MAEGERDTPQDRGVRVVLIQPHALVRQGMAQVLEASAALRVVAHTGAASEGVGLARDFSPDVVLLDEDLLDGEAAGALEELTAIGNVPVVVLAEQATQARVERALGAGAGGYLLKESGIQEFVDAILRAADGESVLAPQAAACLARSFTASRGQSDQLELTPRQREILRLMAAGMENKQIARRLGIGVHTVKTHVSRILSRLGVHSRTEAVVMALRDRLIV